MVKRKTRAERYYEDHYRREPQYEWSDSDVIWYAIDRSDVLLAGAIKCRDNAARYKRERDEANTRAEAAERDADRAIVAMTTLWDLEMVEHGPDCPEDDTCRCIVHEHLGWLTTGRVKLARERLGR